MAWVKIGRGAAIGASLGALKGMVDLHELRSGGRVGPSNLFADEEPPSGYASAAGVGALGGGIIGGLLLSLPGAVPPGVPLPPPMFGAAPPMGGAALAAALAGPPSQSSSTVNVPNRPQS